MLAFPAIEIRDGHASAPVGPDDAGGAAGTAPWLDDPVQIARRWIAAGFERLHVAVGASPEPSDDDHLVRDLLRHATVPVQVADRTGTDDSIAALFADGADWVVVGTRALDDPAWLGEQSELAPGRIVASLELRDRKIVSPGWRKDTRREILDLLAELGNFPLGGLLVRAHRQEERAPRQPGQAQRQESRPQLPDLALFEEIASGAPWPVIAWDCAASMQDLRNLEDRGVSAAVLGPVFSYLDLDPRVVAEEFAELRSPSV